MPIDKFPTVFTLTQFRGLEQFARIVLTWWQKIKSVATCQRDLYFLGREKCQPVQRSHSAARCPKAASHYFGNVVDGGVRSRANVQPVCAHNA